MLLRYGWGLEPSQVCGLIKGLSPRAYRKEITRGVDELTERMRAVERGSWCSGPRAGAEGVRRRARRRRAAAPGARPSRPLPALRGVRRPAHAAISTISAGPLRAPRRSTASTATSALGDRIADLGDRAAGLVSRGGSASVDAGTVRSARDAAGRGGPAPRAQGSWRSSPGSARPGRSSSPAPGEGWRRRPASRRGSRRSGSGATRTVDRRRRASDERARHQGTRAAGARRWFTSRRCRRRSATNGCRRHRRPARQPSGAGRPSRPSPPARRRPRPSPAPVEPTVATSAPPTEQEFGVGDRGGRAARAPARASRRPRRAAASRREPSNVRQEFGP